MQPIRSIFLVYCWILFLLHIIALGIGIGVLASGTRVDLSAYYPVITTAMLGLISFTLIGLLASTLAPPSANSSGLQID